MTKQILNEYNFLNPDFMLAGLQGAIQKCCYNWADFELGIGKLLKYKWR